MSFKNFSFNSRIAANIVAAGYTTPTPVQKQAIPKIMQGADLIGLAQTGTGKTAALVLPMLQRLMRGQRGTLRALVIAPTRELAEQIHETITSLGTRTGLHSTMVFGGVGIQPQIKQLRRTDIVVACPGRLLDHIGRQTVDLSRLEMLVLDEADQMFDMGFLPDIRRILTHLPPTGCQTLLFSATMPAAVHRLADNILNNPVKIQAGNDAPAHTVSHAFYPVAHHLKTALLLELLGKTPTGPVLVFTRTKHRARQLGGKLAKVGYRSTSLQGNLSQARRRDAMRGFKSGKYQILVATDIAARGIDVAQVSHVINYDMPSTPEAYIHRIGRTGRAECRGEAFTLLTGEDKQMARAINAAIGRPVERRTLEYFDYKVPGPAGGNQPRQRGPKRSTGKRRGPKGNRHTGNGAFGFLSPRRARKQSRAALGSPA